MRHSFKVTTTAARKSFKATLMRVRKGGRAVLTNHDRIVGAIVSPEDYLLLRSLRAIEDARDAEDVRKARAEIAEHGTIPWEQVKAELRLQSDEFAEPRDV